MFNFSLNAASFYLNIDYSTTSTTVKPDKFICKSIINSLRDHSYLACLSVALYNISSSERQLCLSDCRTSAPLDADFAAAGLRCALDLADAALGLWAETPAAAQLVRGFCRRYFWLEKQLINLNRPIRMVKTLLAAGGSLL